MSTVVQSSWLTSVRLQRLADALRLIPSAQSGISLEDAVRSVWPICGGPHDEIKPLLNVLQYLGLISEALRRTRAGDRVAKSVKGGDLRQLGVTLIRAGCFHDQARILIECGKTDGDGNLSCPAKLARSGAPQLLGLLQWWEGIQMLPSVVVPKQLITELNTVWALLPPAPSVPSWAAERKAVGDRAEMYSLQCERTKVADPALIAWVARDSDTLGWDLEDRSSDRRRFIEVKGRRNHEVVFFLSENEWNKALQLGDDYEIQFWGGIDLAREPAVEYAQLMAAGYPAIIRNLAREVANESWQATAVRWRIAQKGAQVIEEEL